MTVNTKLGIVAGVLVAGAGAVWAGVWWSLTQTATVPSQTIVERVTPELAEASTQSIITGEAARHTDGVIVPAAEANRWPLAIMIENAAFGGVRPQSGLSAAQIIYELPVEGGITRFLAVFAGELPDKIGPIRSARATYLEFVAEYDALYGHAGGSPEAMAAVDGLTVKDLSALAEDSRFFYRDTKLVAPHNLFTTGELLTKALRDKRLDLTEPDYEPWLFKDAAPVEELMVDPVEIDFGSGPLYAIRYDYNKKTNSYDRSNGGELQTDAVTGDPLSPTTVIVQIVPAAIPAGDEGRVNYAVTGTGKAYFAMDGQVIEGTWSKLDRAGRTVFRDAAGNRLALNRGQIWISIVPASGTVVY
ncbi:MAG: hypothetical protein ACD_41C00306G0013 [uncultured bacterium]|nr:MAG: hypothetical protein ACD_41C00306G0013 [uncultured bacterium]HBY74254.1 hypothetical protein [Candidatus Kerfeldbacteria bacterium]